jgi:choline transport protein
MFVITVVVLSKAQPKQPASFVFTDFENFSGWTNNVIAFITGFINANYSFSCLDAATHIAEEIPNPERNIPKALLTIPVIGVLSSLFYNISMVFAPRCSVLTASSFQFKIMILLSGRQQGILPSNFITRLSRMLAAPSFCKLCSCVPVSSVSLAFTPGNLEWYSPLLQRFNNGQMWSFARDKAFPFSNTWAKVNTRLGVPLNAHIACNAIVVLLGALYVASATAFNSLVIGVIIFQYLSYSVPIVLMLIRGRNSIPHGPFWLGKFGFFCNIVTYVAPLRMKLTSYRLCWTVFTTIFFCFPAVMPVEADNMNYISVILVGYFLLAMFWWLVRGRKVFRGPQGGVEFDESSIDAMSGSSDGNAQ